MIFESVYCSLDNCSTRVLLVVLPICETMVVSTSFTNIVRKLLPVELSIFPTGTLIVERVLILFIFH